jgi:endonuclease/exonuclease/phosphatase family metal-dependent hydrolase
MRALRRIMVIGLLAVLAVSAGADCIRVATWNVENYLPVNRRVDGVFRPDYPKPENEKQALREVIRSINADVLALQEMGPMPFLKELQEDLASEGLDYPYVVLMEAADPARHVAVLSRLPWEEVIAHDDLDFPYLGERFAVKRGLLEIVFRAPDGEPWHLFVVHLKSRWTEHAEDPQAVDRRTREAQAARDRIRSRLPPQTNPRYIVCGDLNDTRDSAAVRRFLQVGGTPLTLLLPAADDRGHAWTHHYGREDTYQRIDYILPSPAMAEKLGPGGIVVESDPKVEVASDHRPLYADFCW